MAKKHQKFTPEFREEIAKLVVDGQRSISEVAREYGLSDTTVGNWVRKYRADHAEDEPPLQLSDRARLRELERENSFLKKAAAYFAREQR